MINRHEGQMSRIRKMKATEARKHEESLKRQQMLNATTVITVPPSFGMSPTGTYHCL